MKSKISQSVLPDESDDVGFDDNEFDMGFDDDAEDADSEYDVDIELDVKPKVDSGTPAVVGDLDAAEADDDDSEGVDTSVGDAPENDAAPSDEVSQEQSELEQMRALLQIPEVQDAIKKAVGANSQPAGDDSPLTGYDPQGDAKAGLDGVEFITEEEFDEALADHNKFNETLKKAVLAGQELALRSVIPIIGQQVKRGIKIERLSAGFYERNPELIPFAATVVQIAKKVEAEFPNKSYEAQLLEIEKRAKAYMAEATKNARTVERTRKPAFANAGKGGRRPARVPKIEGLEAELAELTVEHTY